MTVGELVNKCPNAKRKLKSLFDVFHTLENILQNEQASLFYHQFMLEVIAEKEREEGNVKYDFMSYRITTDFEEVKKKYGGTVLLPLM
jgi:hypothetical protein